MTARVYAQVTPAIESLRPYVPGKPPEELERERGIKNALKLASNENPLGASPRVAEAIGERLKDVHRYPDAAAFSLRRQLGEHLGVAPEQLCFGNGSNELIELVIRTFTTPADHIVFGDPSFVVYRSGALAHNVPFTAVPLVAGRYDVQALLDAVRPETRAVLIASPNNPTGTYLPQPDLQRLLDALSPQTLVVLDEAYFEYATASDYPDGVKALPSHPGLVVLRTFSKAYGLAGLRAGYSVSSPRIADYLNRVRAPFNLSSLAQAAASAALSDQAFLRRCVALNTEERGRVSAELVRLGMHVLPSQANFVWCELPTYGSDLGDDLLGRGVIVRPLSADGRVLRISIGSPEENSRMLSALSAVLGAD